MKKMMFILYDRTIKNCRFYEKEGDHLRLLNEIGCLRGIAYCLEECAAFIADNEFLHFISISNELLDDKNK